MGPPSAVQARRRLSSSIPTIGSLTTMPLPKVTTRAPGSRRVSTTNPGTSRVWSAPTSRMASQTAWTGADVTISLWMDGITSPRSPSSPRCGLAPALEAKGGPAVVHAEEAERPQAQPLRDGPDGVPVHVQAGILRALPEEQPDRRGRAERLDRQWQLGFELGPRAREQEHQLSRGRLHERHVLRQPERLDDPRHAV